jgi:hypothetical protein
VAWVNGGQQAGAERPAPLTHASNIGKDRHIYRNYNVTLPGGATVKGIEVRLDARADSTAGTTPPRLCVQLSWDGGTTWTAVQNTANLTASEATYTLGGAANMWGRTSWTATQLNNTNFRVRVTQIASDNTRDFFLDWIAVRVNY